MDSFDFVEACLLLVDLLRYWVCFHVEVPYCPLEVHLVGLESQVHFRAEDPYFLEEVPPEHPQEVPVCEEVRVEEPSLEEDPWVKV